MVPTSRTPSWASGSHLAPTPIAGGLDQELLLVLGLELQGRFVAAPSAPPPPARLFSLVGHRARFFLQPSV